MQIAFWKKSDDRTTYFRRFDKASNCSPLMRWMRALLMLIGTIALLTSIFHWSPNFKKPCVNINFWVIHINTCNVLPKPTTQQLRGIKFYGQGTHLRFLKGPAYIRAPFKVFSVNGQQVQDNRQYATQLQGQADLTYIKPGTTIHIQILVPGGNINHLPKTTEQEERYQRTVNGCPHIIKKGQPTPASYPPTKPYASNCWNGLNFNTIP